MRESSSVWGGDDLFSKWLGINEVRRREACDGKLELWQHRKETWDVILRYTKIKCQDEVKSREFSTRREARGSILRLLFYFNSFVPGSGYYCVLAEDWAAGSDARVAGQTRGRETTQRLAETIGAWAMNVST